MKLRPLGLAWLSVLLLAVSASAQSDQTVYDNALENGWQSYGWATLDYGNTNPVHGGGGDSLPAAH